MSLDLFAEDPVLGSTVSTPSDVATLVDSLETLSLLPDGELPATGSALCTNESPASQGSACDSPPAATIRPPIVLPAATIIPAGAYSWLCDSSDSGTGDEGESEGHASAALPVGGDRNVDGAEDDDDHDNGIRPVPITTIADDSSVANARLAQQLRKLEDHTEATHPHDAFVHAVTQTRLRKRPSCDPQEPIAPTEVRSSTGKPGDDDRAMQPFSLAELDSWEIDQLRKRCTELSIPWRLKDASARLRKKLVQSLPPHEEASDCGGSLGVAATGVPDSSPPARTTRSSSASPHVGDDRGTTSCKTFTVVDAEDANVPVVECAASSAPRKKSVTWADLEVRLSSFSPPPDNDEPLVPHSPKEVAQTAVDSKAAEKTEISMIFDRRHKAAALWQLLVDHSAPRSEQQCFDAFLSNGGAMEADDVKQLTTDDAVTTERLPSSLVGVAREDEEVRAIPAPAHDIGENDDIFVEAFSTVVYPAELCEALPISPWAVDEDADAERDAGGARWEELERKPDAPLDREEALTRREYDGLLHFQLVTNDGSGTMCDTLHLVANLFARQLPKMGEMYVCKLTFDPAHLAVACIDRGRVIAAALFRPHHSLVSSVPADNAPMKAVVGKRKHRDVVVADTCTLMQANPAPKTVPATEAFAELSFFCVDTARQVEGLGTRLMHRLKAELVRMGLPKILVYADSGAISFFQAQGFTHHVTVGEADLEGRIAHYVDSALMECALVEGLPYTRLPLLVRRARTRMLNKWATGEVADKSGDAECGLCDDVFADEVDENIPPLNKLERRHRQPLHRLTPVHVGANLSRALRSLGRELADPSRLTTDIGAPGCGWRLTPARVGNERLLAEPSVSIDLNRAMASLLDATTIDAADDDGTLRDGLLRLSRRHACETYTDTEQVLADGHRLGLTPLLLPDASASALRLVLRPPP